MRVAVIALAAATLLGGAAAQAQTFEVGPRGVGVDIRGPRERVIEREVYRDDYRDRRRAARFRDRDDLRTGSVGCREVTIRERDEFGRMITRTRRSCR